MPGGSPLLTQGRSAIVAGAATLAATLLSGLGRELLLPLLRGLVVGIPGQLLPRIALGIAYDLPPALAVVLLCLLGSRLLTLSPWRTALLLVVLVWGLDAATTAHVAHDMRLWTDPAVALPRLVVAATTVLASASLLGARPFTKAGPDEPV